VIYFTQNFYWPITTLTKFSFLFLFLAIFPQAKLRKCVYATMALTLVNFVFFQFANIFYCRPISKVWDWADEEEGSCLNIYHLMVSGAGMTVLLDSIIIVLPVQQLLRLNLSFGKKVAILAIFGVGIL
jgi:hypothetical protein